MLGISDQENTIQTVLDKALLIRIYKVIYDLWTFMQEMISLVFMIKNFIQTYVRLRTVTELWPLLTKK